MPSDSLYQAWVDAERRATRAERALKTVESAVAVAPGVRISQAAIARRLRAQAERCRVLWERELAFVSEAHLLKPPGGY